MLRVPATVIRGSPESGHKVGRRRFAALTSTLACPTRKSRYVPGEDARNDDGRERAYHHLRSGRPTRDNDRREAA
jgi:hypothetical protein